ncbi:MAG: hypothetical protein GY696_33915 [Gammaproteobacteria bacterium]|nr:hypothetical protein [Gammaproteobacteria bacterium]
MHLPYLGRIKMMLDTTFYMTKEESRKVPLPRSYKILKTDRGRSGLQTPASVVNPVAQD